MSGMRTVEYIIGLTDYNKASLEKRIDEKLKAGYEKVGEINSTVINHYGDKKYAVKMIKFKEGNEYADYPIAECT